MTPATPPLCMRAPTAFVRTATAANKLRYQYADRHLVFSERSQDCFRITGGLCFLVSQPAKGRHYTRVQLGKDASGERVYIDAHRLVCILTQGPPAATGAVAKHTGCTDKSCINRWHLQWGTQKSNVAEARGDRSATRARLTSAPLPLVLWGVEPRRRRVVLRPFQAHWCGARRLRRPVLRCGSFSGALGHVGHCSSRPDAPQTLAEGHILDPGSSRQHVKGHPLSTSRSTVAGRLRGASRAGVTRRRLDFGPRDSQDTKWSRDVPADQDASGEGPPRRRLRPLPPRGKHLLVSCRPHPPVPGPCAIYFACMTLSRWGRLLRRF